MTLVTVSSMRGSPGSTTMAMDLARAGGPSSLLVEADPDGGCLAARLGLALKPGLTELAATARAGIAAADLTRFAQTTVSGLSVVVAHPSAEQVHAALRAAVSHIAAALRVADILVVADIGRFRPGSAALAIAQVADANVVLSANSVDAIATLSHRNELIAELGRVVICLTEGSPYPPTEIAANLDRPVWGVVPRGTTRRRARRRREAIAALMTDLVGGALA